MDHTSTKPVGAYPTRRSLREAAARAAAASSGDESTDPPVELPQEYPEPIFMLGSTIPAPVSFGPAVTDLTLAPAPRKSRVRRVIGSVAAAASACALFSVMMLPSFAPFDASTQAVAAEAQRFTSDRVSSALEAGSLAQLEAPEAELVGTPTSAAFTGDPDALVQYPIAGSVTLTDGFGPRSYPVAGFHGGQDFAAAAGTPVMAMADGVIASSGFINGRCGFGVQIEHQVDGQDVTTLGCHMQAGSPMLSVGDAVAKGEQVGRVGSTGLSFGAHLHFEVEVAGEQLDPMPYLAHYSKAPVVQAGTPANAEAE